VSKVTRILSAIEQGDLQAAEQLLPLVYDELRQLAAEKLAQERPGQTLQATALVHEAYLRLVEVDKAQHWDSRRHFFAAAAEAMRRILIDNARRKRTGKHGGGLQRLELDDVEVPAATRSPDLLALDEALTKLAAEDPLKAQLVTALLRRAVRSGSGRGPRHLARNCGPLLVLCPALALLRAARHGRRSRTQEKFFGELRRAAEVSRIDK
jgi:RNA polymerase sigma factor (TIGR02999 family)